MIDEHDFSQFIVDAARLRLHQIKRDQLLKSFSGVTIFALDTGTIKLFTDPASNQFGRIFRRDSDTDATALSLALAEFIFFENSALPLFQFVPHARETATIFDIVASAAVSQEEQTINSFEALLEESTNKERNFLKRNYESDLIEYRDELLSREKSIEEKDQFFQSKLEKLLALSLPSKSSTGQSGRPAMGIQKEYRRFLSLYANQKIMDQFDLADLLEESDEFDNLASAFLHEGSISDWARASERKQGWLKDFSRHKMSRRLTNLENDAQVLSDLEGLNERLHPFDVQVILLTGDPLLHASVRQRQSSSMHVKILDPIAFVFEAISWQNGRDQDHDNTRKFSNWLDGLLTTYTGGKWRFIKELENLASEKPESLSALQKSLDRLSSNGESPFESVLETWDGFKKPILALELIYRNDEDDLVLSSIQEISTLTERREIVREVERLGEVARNQLDQRWDDILIAFTTAGIEILFAFRREGRRKQRPRNPPLIRFDGFPTATELVRNLTETHDLTTLKDLIEHKLNSLERDTLSRQLGNTDLGYVTCLVWGALCASEGKWAVTRGLASRAVRISQSGEIQSRDGVIISGREAFFLLAVSQRLTISIDKQNVSSSLQKANTDLDVALGNLQKAKAALAGEVSEKNHESNKSKTVRGLRFGVEELAVEVTRLNINYWFGESDLEKSIDVLHKNLEMLERFPLERETNATPDQVHSMRVMTINLCINALQCAHVCIRSGEAETARKLIIDAGVATTLTNMIAKEGVEREWDFHRTLLIDAYSCFASQLSGRFTKREAKGCSNTFVMLRDETAHVMPYDMLRFADLEKLIGELDLG